MYVIGRLAPDHPSGCVYWDGWTKVEGGPALGNMAPVEFAMKSTLEKQAA
ncbi:Uncharacterised protein [Starkeya nomas]|uniref:Uncharacterized protein n=2 Tax=Starkeya nomas TaxID=2666134 RepID=A0A5S9Q3N9_9HYPH|nr:Uncharacterised protein [Starkeya nomas]